MADSTYIKNIEPPLDELINEQITRLLMARDGIQVGDVVELIQNAKAALRLREK